jgi:LPXTG-motif cell wall-anchored protein
MKKFIMYIKKIFFCLLLSFTILTSYKTPVFASYQGNKETTSNVSFYGVYVNENDPNPRPPTNEELRVITEQQTLPKTGNKGDRWMQIIGYGLLIWIIISQKKKSNIFRGKEK